MENIEINSSSAGDESTACTTPSLNMYNNMLKLYTDDQKERSAIMNDSVSRVMRNDEEINGMLSQAIRYEAARKTNAMMKAKRPKVNIFDKVSPDQEMILSEEFSEFELNFDRANNRGDHPFYRCYRRLSEKRIDNEFLHPLRSQHSNYDVLIKDVGGNPITHIETKHKEHTCMPILDDNDALRHAKYLKRLRSFVPKSENSRVILNKHINQEREVICHDKAENCKVKSPFLKFLHSSYNISVENLCMSMFKANAVEGRGVFLFSPKILREDEGELGHGLNYYKYKTSDGEIMVRYYFDDDLQAAYTHNLVNIYKLLKTFRYELKVGDQKTTYLFSFRRGLANHVEFEIYKHEFGSIPMNNMSRVLKESGVAESIVVYWYRWETLNEGDHYFDYIMDHMKPIRLVVPKKLYMDLVSYANTLDDKLTVKNILIAANAMNTREVINGQEVGLKEKVDPETLKHLANSVWFFTYISNYECSKVIGALRQDEERVRKLSGKNLHKRVFSRFVQKLFKENRCDYDVVVPQMTTNCENTLKLQGLLKNMQKNSSVVRNFDICISDRLCNVMTLEEEMDMLIEEANMHGDVYKVTYVEDELRDDKRIKANMLHNLNEEKVKVMYDVENCASEVCYEDLTEIQNRNEGDCFYQSVRDLRITNEDSEAIRCRLRSSVHLSGFKNKTEIVERLISPLGKSEAFVNIDVAYLFALEYDVSLCVHTNVRHVQLNSVLKKEKYHVKFSNNHCTALKLFMTVEKVFEMEKDKECTAYDKSIMNKQLDAFFASNKQQDKVKRAKLNAYHIDNIGLCGYNNRAGLKTAEIFYRYFENAEIESALSLGGPGAEVEFLIEKKGCRVFGMTLIDGTKSGYDIKDYNAFTQIFGEKGTGDITDRINVAGAIQEIKDLNGKVDFCGCDIATSEEKKDIDYAKNADLFKNEVIMSSALLKDGGFAYFKVFDFIEADSVMTLNYLHDSFESVKYVKLETSRPWSTERHVICKNFKFDKEKLTMLVRNEYATNDIEKYNYLQKEFDNQLRKNLSMLQRCINTVDTNRPIKMEISDAKRKFYSRTYGIDTDDDNVGMLKKLKNKIVYYFDPSRKIIDDMDTAENVIIGSEEPKIDDDTDCENMSVDSLDIVQELRKSDTYSVDSLEIQDDDDTMSVDSLNSNTDSDISYVTAESGEVKIEEPVVEAEKKIADEIVKKPGLLKKLKNKLKKTEKIEVVEEVESDEDEVSVTEIKTKKSLLKSIKNKFSKKVKFQDDDDEPKFNLKISTWDREVADIDDEVKEDEEKQVEVVEEKESKVQYVEEFDVNSAIKSMEEYKRLLLFTYESEKSNHKRVAGFLESPIKEKLIQSEQGDYGVVEFKDEKLAYVIEPKEKYTYNKYYSIVDNEFVIEKKLVEGKYIVSNYCEKALEMDIYNSIKDIDANEIKKVKSIGIVQAAPGCGKTYYITQKARPAHVNDADNILLSTKAGREDFVARMGKKYNHEFTKDEKCRMRTLVSFLINVKNNKSSDKLFVDEALMSHPGSVMYAIILSKAKEVLCLGDVLQIPFVNRTPGFTVEYEKLSEIVPIVETLYVSWRCPADVAWRLKEQYKTINSKVGIDKGMLAKNNFGNTCSYVKLSNNNVQIKAGIKYLTFTQADKNEMNRKIKNAKIDSICETVHEFQGKEAPIINVIRFDSNKQSELFLRPNYALVALSRHTKQLVYYTRVTTDALSKLIGVDNILTNVVATKTELESVTDMSVGYFETDELLLNSHVECDDKLVKIRGNVEDILDDRIIIRYDENKIDKERIVNDKKTYIVYIRNGELTRLKVKNIIDNKFKHAKKVYVGETTMLIGHEKAISVSPSNDLSYDEEMNNILITNAKLLEPEYKYERKSINDWYYEDVNCESNNSACIQELNYIMDNLFAKSRFSDQSMDAWMVNNYDLEMNIDGIKYSRTPRLARQNFDNMKPELKTVMGYERVVSYRENMIAMEKRNKNVPMMTGTVDVDKTSDEMLNKFVTRCLTDKLDRTKLKFTKTFFNDWISRQKTGIEKLINTDFALHKRALNHYNFSIKKQAKPSLAIDAVETYAALQTIVYHDKDINAIFCNIFNNIKKRITRALRPNLLLFADMNNEQFENKINSIVKSMKNKDALEIDISKYDKSQGNLALEFECKLMRHLNVDEYYVKLWYNAHILSKVYDKDTRLSAFISYQRKSGDASTFIGNTIFLMAVISDLVNFEDVDFACFSGDDSYIIGTSLNKYKNTQHFALKFNLDVKFYMFKYGYFCSRFLIHDGNRFHFIPDPIKFIVKLGRHNMANKQHVNEYRISAKDNMKGLKRTQILHIMGEAVKERFGIRYNISALLSTIVTLVKKENFLDLYYSEKGDKINNDKKFNIKNM